MKEIRVAIAGVGNCASSLIQGIHYYANSSACGANETVGLAHPVLGGLVPGDINKIPGFPFKKQIIWL